MFRKLFASKSAPTDEDVPPPITMRTILTPVDMRHPEASEKAIATAVWMARLTVARLAIVTADRPPGELFLKIPESTEAELEAFVAAESKTHGLDIMAIHRVHESPVQMVKEVTKEIGADLIVMASHNPRFTDHIFGSNASQIALHAPCSVLVVR